MALFVYNGLAGKKELMAKLQSRVRERELPHDADSATKARLQRDFASDAERRRLEIKQELDARDAELQVWGVPGLDEYPLALSFRKGEPVEVEAPTPKPNARKKSDEEKRWSKLMALVDSGTLEMAAEKPAKAKKDEKPAP